MSGAKRDNSGKPMFSFILDFPKALLGFASVKTVGAIKYDFDNWKKGGKPDREYLDACLRHMVSFQNGESFASDTGCHHLAHAMWNLAALMELNVDKVVDPDGFKASCEFWQSKKQEQPTDGLARIYRMLDADMDHRGLRNSDATMACLRGEE